MESTKCNFLLSAEGVPVAEILAARPMQHAVIPELDDLIAASEATHYSYSKTFKEAVNDPYPILHTSGSTGSPKPFIFRHGGMAAMDRQGNLPDIDEVTGRRRRRITIHPGSVRYFLGFPQFHAVSSISMMLFTVFGGAIFIPGYRH